VRDGTEKKMFSLNLKSIGGGGGNLANFALFLIYGIVNTGVLLSLNPPHKKSITPNRQNQI